MLLQVQALDLGVEREDPDSFVLAEDCVPATREESRIDPSLELIL